VKIVVTDELLDVLAEEYCKSNDVFIKTFEDYVMTYVELMELYLEK
jgi:hypothetical protein